MKKNRMLCLMIAIVMALTVAFPIGVFADDWDDVLIDEDTNISEEYIVEDVYLDENEDAEEIVDAVKEPENDPDETVTIVDEPENAAPETAEPVDEELNDNAKQLKVSEENAFEAGPGWTKDSDGKWHYTDADGKEATGWKKISGKWYYFNASGVMQTGWQQIGGKWYYLNASGVMQTGWQQIGGKWYYLDASGAMHTGWLELSGKKYYLDNSGAMVTGTQVIDGQTYEFDKYGVLIDSTITEGDFVYEKIDGGLRVKAYNGTSSSSVKVPDTVQGLPVIEIGASAFENHTEIESIDLPDSIVVIGKRAFADCTNLSKMS